MAKKENEQGEQNFSGCYGEMATYADLAQFLEDSFNSNCQADVSGSDERFATCIWGHSGIGKTAIVKQQANKPVKWAFNGDTPKEYPGYAVFNVPIAQFEEMGDLHGLPSRHIKVIKESQDRWVPEEVLQGYLKDGWEVQHSAGVRTMYAPPDWVPSKPGPAILLLDDWNRASVRIIKGIMQLLQNYGMVSWKLPPGCNIVLTANPDEQDYLVTSIDNAILTRIRSVTLKHDAKEWAVWATKNGLDSRGISFLLQYPEMMIGPERTNPRTLAQFFRDLKSIPNIESEVNQKRFRMLAASLLDEQTVSSMMVFMERDVEMIIEPEQIIKGDNQDWSFIETHMNKLMTSREKRIDVVSVICDRLFAHVVQSTTDTDERSVKNFQRFVTMKEIPEDMRHNLCLRLARYKDPAQGNRNHKWLVSNALLAKLIIQNV